MPLLQIIIVLAYAAMGAAIGSFANVCAVRWKNGGSINNPKGSHCPGCQKAIPPWRNIPLISYTLQKGRCMCKEYKIPPKYLLWEITGFFIGAILAKTLLL